MHLKKWMYKIKSSIWLYPMIVGVLSLCFAVVIYLVDAQSTRLWIDHLPAVFKAKVTQARTIHTIAASAFITIMTFTFSTTMVVLTMYMSQLTPRVVENFLSHKNTMRSFAVFVGGFVFSMVSLLLASNFSDGKMVISALLSVIYIVIGLIFFIMFINNVARFIQTSNVIERLYNEAKDNIKNYVDMLMNYEIHAVNDFTKMPKLKGIAAQKSTYIQNVDYYKLRDIAESFDGTIVFNKAVGQFVYKGETLATVHGNQANVLPEDIESKVRGCYMVGDQRTENQDFNYSVQKIVEVALRAISPGVNDPDTAIHCIRMISIVLDDLIRLESGYIFMDEGNDRTGLIFEVFNLEQLMNNTYNQIVHYGSGDASVMLALIKSLTALIEKATTSNQIGVVNYVDYIWEKIEINMQSKREKNMILDAMRELRAKVNA